MAAIDEKMTALEFTTSSAKPPAEVRRLLHDAAQVAQGEKIILTDVSEAVVSGVARNFVRVQHAQFTVALVPEEDARTRVSFRIPNYLRTRETLLVFIPVSPWMAPAYKTMREFSEYVSSRL